MGDEIRIISPRSGGRKAAGKPFTVQLQQQVRSGQGSATLQFSISGNDPWTTCRLPGEGGAVECPVQRWTSQSFEWTIPGAIIHHKAYIRAGVWSGRVPEGDPIHVSVNAPLIKVSTITEDT